MPLEPIDSLGGFTASPGLPLQREEGGDTALATVGKVAAPLAIGAGLLLAPEFTIPALVAGGAAASYADPEAAGAAFRTENTIGSVLSSDEMGVDDRRIDPQFDPWAEIQGTPYEAYYEQFGRAANRGHFDAIKSDIDRENKDRDTLAKSGVVGMGATMAAGVLDLPSLIPGAVVLRSAKGGVSMLKTAAGTAAAGTGAAVASEAALQQSQQLRTAGESATVIAGSAVLSGLLGAGLGRRMARLEFDGLAARVERDFTVPGPGEPDPFMPGSFKPSVEAAAGASEKARSVADAIRETAEEILPAQVRVQVVDSLGPVGDDGLFGLRAPNMADVSFAGTTARARAVGDDGAEIGFVSGTVKGDALIIDKTTLPETHQGKGYGVAMYRALIDAALDRGLRVESAYEVSEKASRVYDALARRGYKVERLPYRIEKKSGGRRLVVTDDLTRRPIAVTGKPEGPAREQLFSLRAKRYAAPEIETPDQIGDALKTIRESVEEAQTAPLKGRFAPDDLRSRFIAYKKADTDLRAALIGGLDEQDALARYAKLRGEAEAIVNDMRKTDARINRDIEKDMKAREGKEQFSLRSAETDQTQTVAFKNWFGDSKVADEGGKPKVVFHGTRQDFEAFDIEAVRATGEPDEAFFFSNDPKTASEYAQPMWDRTASDAQVMPVYLKMENPLRIEQPSWGGRGENADIIGDAKANGHDGIIFTFTKEKTSDGKPLEEFVAFAPNQIKSAIGNRGTFDPADPRITHGLRRGDAGPIAEGRFDPDNLLITIAADALDPAKTLRHESIHALKTMGRFTGKDWGTLEAAAKKGGWLETHNVRGLYEGVYGGRGETELKFKLIRRTRGDSPDTGVGYMMFHETGDDVATGIERLRGYGKNIWETEPRDAVHADDIRDDAETALRKHSDILDQYGVGEDLAARLADDINPSQIVNSAGLWDAPDLVEIIWREVLEPRGFKGVMTNDGFISFDPSQVRRFTGDLYSVRAGAETSRASENVSTRGSNPRLEALLLEEAIAEQFSLWRQGAIQVKGAIAKLFERIQQFLEATGNALRGRGFQTADDVFAAVRSGEVASRAPGASPAAGAIPAAGLGRATSAGASAVQRADDTLKSALGLEKAFYWQDPMLRLQNSLSPASKRHVQELAETPLAYDKNELGEPTAPGGSEMGAPGAVETRIKFWQGALADAVQAVDQGFMKYRTGHAKRFTGETVLLNMRDTVYGTDALTYPQFKQEIAKALRRGDVHQIPEVAGAARIWRQKVLDPLKDEAIEHEMLPEGVTPETAPSYLNRLYNKDKIIAERDQFKTIVADWLEGQESINRGVRIKVAPLLERRKILEERVAKYERQIERRSAATAKIAARRQEASGLNRFAYSRAQKLSEPIDQVRGEIDTIASSIRTQLDRIEELSAAIREEKLNLPEIATVERQSIKIGHALADLKRDAALIDMVEAAESIEKPLAELYEASSGIMGALREQAKFARMTPQAQALVALEKDRAKLGRKIAPFRKKLRDLRTLQQKMEKARTPGARGGAVFESKIRSRVNTLADQEAGKKAAIEDLQMKLDRAQDELNVVTSKLEAEITAYQGKTAGDAKGAIKRRDTAEAARTPEQRAKKARLGSADKAVVTTARKIAAQLDKEPGEITALADEIIDRILGTPDGRLPYDAHKNTATAHGASVDARGPLAARQFMIPDAAIERYLENDIEVLGRAYVRTMAADVEMTKRFGSVDMVDQIKEIAEDYARLSAQAKTPEARRKLHKQRDNDIRDLAAIRDRLRGTYALPKNPDGLLVRSGRVINSLNYMRMLGGMTISAIPDTARTVMVHGLMRTAGDGLVPLLRNWSGARLAMTEVKLAGTALDMVLDSRAMQIADIMDDFGRHSKFERAIQAGARNFGVISLMAPWNAAMKQFAGLVTMTRMLRAVERIAAGKGRPKEVAMLAAGGISEANARKIAAQFAKHGSKEGGVWRANTAAWEERSAIEAFRAALVRDVDRIIVTPGQERPLWMSTETGRLIGQFKSFSISAMQRVLISGLQQRDMATLNGAILMVALGGLASVLRAKVGGQPLPDLSDGQKQAQFLVEAIDRSGLTGWMMEANSMTEKLTRGAVGLSAITGKPVSRYASRNISSALLGPTAGTMQDFTRVVGAAASGEWNQSDSRVMRRLIPYNNIFYLRQMFDEAEAGINGFLGVPKPAGAKR